MYVTKLIYNNISNYEKRYRYSTFIILSRYETYQNRKEEGGY